jgi:hypothetical protein
LPSIVFQTIFYFRDFVLKWYEIFGMQTSSLGSLKKEWLAQMVASFQGLDGIPENINARVETMPIEILFPTQRSIQQSRLGVRGAGTITWNW